MRWHTCCLCARVSSVPKAERIRRERNPVRKIADILGPGIVSGAAQIDPSAIGTYVVAGATLGLGIAWTALWTFPLLLAVQNVAARVGLVARRGLASAIHDRYPRIVMYLTILPLVAATTLNIGADLGAVADSVHIITGVPARLLVPFVAIGVVFMMVFGSYKVISNVLKVLTLTLLAYVADMGILHPDLIAVLGAAIVPSFVPDADFVRTFVAVIGTTVSPYIFFWQSDEEVEEKREDVEEHGAPAEATSEGDLRYATADVSSGMSASQLMMFVIIVSTALTLHASGQRDVHTGADAARALQPLAGDFAAALFATGMIGAGLLSIPVLAGTAGYALGETFGWRVGLDQPLRRAKRFYAVIAVATLVGTAVNFIGVDPIDVLVWSSVMMAIVAPPLVAMLALVGRDKDLMGDRRIGRLHAAAVWLAAGVTTASLIALVVVR
jgi:NRAMP (natural resistance-associated macrophage protein)-like metal ion transporter